MATPFKDIYSRAMFRFQDYDILRFDEYDREQILKKYLKMAEADFIRICHADLTEIELDEEPAYAGDLDNECQEILAAGMAFYWIGAKVASTDNLRNALSVKEYSWFSPANLLREMTTLRDTLRKEFNDRMIRYSYNMADIASLKV